MRTKFAFMVLAMPTGNAVTIYENNQELTELILM